MSQAARRMEIADAVHQEVGTVLSCEDDHLLVKSAAGVFEAKRAVSCLVQPIEHDRVLLAVPKTGPLFVLAVLERESAGVTVVANGPITVKTEDRIALEGREEVTIATKRFGVRASAAKLALGAIDLIARTAEAKLEVAKLVSDAIDTVTERVMTRAKRSYRFVEETDVVRAQNVDLRAEETMTMRSRNSVVGAEQLYKVDAEQIHLG